MAKETKTNNNSLEHKIHVLEEENAQLAERAEESLLLGLISESMQIVSNELGVLENTAEQISILKAIPLVSCGYFDQDEIKPITGYCAFSDQINEGYPISVSPEIISELEYGPYVTRINEHLSFHFNSPSFQPTHVALIAFSTQVHNKGIFLFLDNATDGDRLTPMMALLNQAVNMAATRYDNIFLLKELTRANQELESRVAKRTEDLTRANSLLEKEIEERKASENALSESHQTFLTVLNGIDATIYVADLNTHQILFMNQFMIDTFGKDFTGNTCYKIFRQEEQPCSICTNKKIVDEHNNPTGVVVWQGRNPVTGRDYVNYDRAIKWVDGRIVRLQIATDITAIKQIESQIQQAKKLEALGTLAGGIAHDFNNLLMTIQGHASLMTYDLKGTHPCYEHANSIMEATRSATSLTKQLLGVARGGKYEVEPIDLNDIVIASSNMFGRTRKEIRIHKLLHDPPPVIAADRRQLEQVLLNMYINAWQAMPNGGELYLKTFIIELDDAFCSLYSSKAGKYGRISITDTGIGMDKLTQERIFDPFFTTKEKSRGTGLGLASAYGIIKNHDGMITIDSKVGKGSTFNIYLPLTEKSAKYLEITEDKEFTQGSGTILLVDDEEMVIKVGKLILEKIGYQVVLAKTGHEAVDIIARQFDQINLVILDMIMPDMGGMETFDRIREINPVIPVILSSGYSINGQAMEIMRKGCNGFIQKPFSISELSMKIQQFLVKPKL